MHHHRHHKRNPEYAQIDKDNTFRPEQSYASEWHHPPESNRPLPPMYEVPNLGIEHDIITSEQNLKNAEKKLGVKMSDGSEKKEVPPVAPAVKK